jgi:hypothetical protein
MSDLPKPESILGKKTDGHWDKDLAEQLKLEPEVVRLEFLASILTLQEKTHQQSGLFFRIAQDVLQKASSFEHLLRQGLRHADASTVKTWLVVCARRIGTRRLVRVLEDVETTNPEGVERAEYWLMTLASNEDERRMLRRFHDEPHRVARRNRRRKES